MWLVFIFTKFIYTLSKDQDLEMLSLCQKNSTHKRGNAKNTQFQFMKATELEAQ